MGIRRLALRSVAARAGVVTLASALLVGAVAPQALAAGANTPCGPNSNYTGYAASSQECVAGLLVKTRGYVQERCLIEKWNDPDAVYEPGECYGNSAGKMYAEAIAQARFIAQMNARGVHGDAEVGGITANLQWETVLQNSSGATYTGRKTPGATLRPDALFYHRELGNSAQVEVVEVKLAAPMGEGLTVAQSQVAAYVEQLRHDDVDAVPMDFSTSSAVPGLSGYRDSFRVAVDRCSDGAPVERTIRFVSQPVVEAPGVLLVESETQQRDCQDHQPQGPWTTKESGSEGPPVQEPVVMDFGDCMAGVGEGLLTAAEWLHEVLSGAHMIHKAFRYATRLPPGVTVNGLAAGAQALTADAVVAAEGATVVEGTVALAVPIAVVTAGVALGLTASCAIQPNVFGDPHLVTLDSLPYDLQAVGEFHLLQSPDGRLDVQARYAPMGASTSISVLAGVAMRIGDETVEVASDGSVLINGDPSIIGVDGTESLSDGSVVVKSKGTTLVATSEPSVLIKVQDGVIGIMPADGVATRGLLGDHDGDPSNDLKAADGEQFDKQTPAHTLYGAFAESWRVTDATSAFTYANGQSTESFTDRSFPTDVKKLSDFSQSALDAATSQCREQGVKSPSGLESCVYDLVTTGDIRYATAAAAVSDQVVDPSAPVFASDGSLVEDFSSPVSSAFAAPSYLQGATDPRIAGPYFDDSPYSFALIDVPRHDTVTMTLDVHAFGAASQGSPQRLDVQVDGTTVGTVTFGADEASYSGTGGSARLVSSGQTQAGEPDREYQVTTAIDHATSSVKVTLVPHEFYGLLDTAFGIGKIRLDLAAPPADSFSVTLPVEISPDAPFAGAGRLETPGSQDDYAFVLNADQAAAGLVLNSDCHSMPFFSLTRVDTGQRVPGVPVTCSTTSYQALSAGQYVLSAQSKGEATGYSASLFERPAAQVMGYQVGDTVSDGVPESGAGNLETTASKDSYEFSVPAGGQTVVFDSEQYNWILYYGSHLVRVADGADLGPINGHRVFDLDVGDYRIDVEHPGNTGTYAFSSFVPPEAQTFSYQVGQSVSDGVPESGAGNLETTASRDSYEFSVPAGGQTVVFDSEQYSWPLYYGSHVVRLSDGADLGPINGHRVYDLREGAYRIDVEHPGNTGTYAFSSYVPPEAQTFSYQVGESVSEGVPGPGAGNLETTASKDSYEFSVPAGGQRVVFDSEQYNWPLYYGSHVVRVADGADLGPVNGHRVYDLSEGAYRIDVEFPGNTGTYAFSSYVPPEAQTFSYQVGESVSEGVPGPGAGNLETTASKDSYEFSVAAGGQRVVFDSDQYNWILYYGSHLVRVSDGADLGPVNGHRVYDLSEGDYRIDVEYPGSTGTYSFTSAGEILPQTFAYEVGQTVAPGEVGGVAAEGAGNLETTQSKDSYEFSVAAGGQRVVFDSDYYNWVLYYGSHLVRVSDGADLGPVNGHRVYDLSEGDYRIDVEYPGNTGTYAFSSYVPPAAQAFTYEVGQVVEPGQIGGVAAEGAGNLETTASKDSYAFSVPVGGQKVVFDSDYYSWPLYYGSHLVRVADGADLGPVNGHRVYDLSEGDYRIDVEHPGNTGTYAFSSFVAPAAQEFTYQVGDSVSDGVPGPGAGNLETTASKDSYAFSVPVGGQKVVFDSDQYNWILYYGSHVVRLSDGADLGPVNGHRVYDLEAGEYRIDVEHPGGAGTYAFSSFVAPAAQQFTYEVGQVVEPGLIGGVAAEGAGNLETTASKDSYAFSVPVEGQRVVFDSDQYNWILYYGSHLVRVADGADLGPVNGHRVYDLSEGDYRIDVEYPGGAGTYAFSSFVAPAAQAFTYEVGQVVEPGQIGGVAAEGAGNLETTASKDSYAFSVPVGGQRVVFDSDYYNWILYYGSHLVRVADGADLGPVNGHRVYDLSEGDYRIDVEYPGGAGTYAFTSSTEPPS